MLLCFVLQPQYVLQITTPWLNNNSFLICSRMCVVRCVLERESLWVRACSRFASLAWQSCIQPEWHLAGTGTVEIIYFGPRANSKQTLFEGSVQETLYFCVKPSCGRKSCALHYLCKTTFCALWLLQRMLWRICRANKNVDNRRLSTEIIMFCQFFWATWIMRLLFKILSLE
jgi:hypothetical protein